MSLDAPSGIDEAREAVEATLLDSLLREKIEVAKQMLLASENSEMDPGLVDLLHKVLDGNSQALAFWLERLTLNLSSPRYDSLPPLLDEVDLHFEHCFGKKMPDVLREAFLAVDRSDFVLPYYKPAAYMNQPLPIGMKQTISQPAVVAHMLKLLDVKKSHRVLDVGAGSGYNAALLGQLASEVHSIERIGELAEFARMNVEKADITNVSVHHGDGYKAIEGLTFDRIIAAAAVPDDNKLLANWVKSLNPDGGKLLFPRQVAQVAENSFHTQFKILERHGAEVSVTDCPGDFGFVPCVVES